MKRTLHAVLAAALALGLALPTAAAQIGAVAGHTYYTDIVARIDGRPLRSYNIGGETAVVAEDLREYGFSVVWNGEARTLTVERDLEGAVTGDYQPQREEQRVGTVSGDIYFTDIKTYVQGEEVESFALNGETAISFSQLERAGTLTWDEGSRTASLALAADPMEFTLAQKEQELKQTGFSYTFQRYPGPHGTAVVYALNGVPHGSARGMDYVSERGAVLSVTDLLPAYGFGAGYYIQPRDVRFDGYYGFSFITPVKAEADGVGQDWGECLCSVDTLTGTIRITRLGVPLEDWRAGSLSDPDAEEICPEEPLSVTVTRPAGAYEAVVEQAQLPSEAVEVSLSSEGITVRHSAGFFQESGESSYGEAYQALSRIDLPDLTAGDTETGNTQPLREQVRQWFRVEKNALPVQGDLWWGQGNNHRDLNFTFDSSLTLSEGDVVTLWIGVQSGAGKEKEILSK